MMTHHEACEKTLNTMLTKLGFEATYTQEETPDGFCIHIETAEEKHIIGQNGERLDDLQYLVNRIVQKQFPDCDRVRLDCGRYRETQEQRLKEEVLDAVERVKESGRPFKFRPLNAYYRRIVHNTVVDDDEIETASPRGDERLKKITISLKG